MHPIVHISFLHAFKFYFFSSDRIVSKVLYSALQIISAACPILLFMLKNSKYLFQGSSMSYKPTRYKKDNSMISGKHGHENVKFNRD